MKKTLVAVAAFAAIAGAHAEATIYGVFDQAYTTATTSANGGVVTTRTNGLGSPWTGNGFVMGVKAGEDLADGLKLSGVYELGLNLNATTAASTAYSRQSFVALSGAFGQVRAGRQYPAAFNNVAAVDPGGVTTYGTLYQGVLTDGSGLGESPLRQSNNVQYDLPNLMAGVNIGLNIVRAGANTISGVATGDGQGFNVNYTSGPLYVGYTSDSAINLGAGQLVAGTPRIVASQGDQRKLTTTSASYDFGVAKIGYNNSTTSIANDKIDTTMFAISAPIGAATVYVSSSTGDQSGAVVTALKGTEFGANYSLSKRTTVYGRLGTVTIGGNAAETKSTAIGIQHAF